MRKNTGVIFLIFCFLIGISHEFSKENIVWILLIAFGFFYGLTADLEKRCAALEKRCDGFWIHIQEKMGR